MVQEDEKVFIFIIRTCGTPLNIAGVKLLALFCYDFSCMLSCLRDAHFLRGPSLHVDDGCA